MNIRIARSALWIVNGLLAVVVVFFAFRAFASGQPDGQPAPGEDLTMQPAADAAAQPISDRQVDEIISSGTIVPLPPPPPQPPPSKQPEEPEEVDVLASFPYDLIGTIVEPEQAYAFFQDRLGKQSVHAVGERVGGATLVEVSDSRAVIEIDGRRGEITRVSAEERAAQVSVAAITMPWDRAPGREVASATPDIPADSRLEEEAYLYDDEFEELDWNIISERQYTDYVQNLGKYVSQVVVLSHYDAEKKPDGLILTRVPRESEAYKRGLREGDIVKTVQGEPVTDLQAAIRAAFQVLRDNEYLVDVVIERKGVEEVLSYEVWPE